MFKLPSGATDFLHLFYTQHYDALSGLLSSCAIENIYIFVKIYSIISLIHCDSLTKLYMTWNFFNCSPNFYNLWLSGSAEVGTSRYNYLRAGTNYF